MRFAKFFLIGCLFLAPTAFPAVIFYTATLTGPGESPPNASPATGDAAVTIDDIAQTMHVHVTFSGLVGTTSGTFIQCCTPVPLTGTAGIATQVPTFTGFPTGVTAGLYDNTFDLTDAGTYNPAFVTAHGGTVGSAEAFLLAGMAADEAYLNIHTTVFPGGEISGFLVATPEPSSLLLAGGALVGLALLRRRRV